jgi:hypothetical protein
MSEEAQPGQEAVETPSNPAEENLRPEEKAALDVSRNGLPKPDLTKPETGPKRPDNVPEKFWDADKGEIRVDELTSSYAALEAKLSQSPSEEEGSEEEADGDVEVKNGKISKKAEEASGEGSEDEVPAVTGLIQSAATEFTESGGFTEETTAALAAQGIPVEIQQVYLAGLTALQDQQTATVQGYVGGEEQYNAMAQWAGQNLSDAELEAFNSALDNPALAENAVSGLYSRFQKARPNEGRQIGPTNGAPDSGDVFASRKEMTDAMSDPRYRNDAAYQRSVVDKLRRTRAAGTSFNK